MTFPAFGRTELAILGRRYVAVARADGHGLSLAPVAPPTDPAAATPWSDPDHDVMADLKATAQ